MTDTISQGEIEAALRELARVLEVSVLTCRAHAQALSPTWLGGPLADILRESANAMVPAARTPDDDDAVEVGLTQLFAAWRCVYAEHERATYVVGRVKLRRGRRTQTVEQRAQMLTTVDEAIHIGQCADALLRCIQRLISSQAQMQLLRPHPSEETDHAEN